MKEHLLAIIFSLIIALKGVNCDWRWNPKSTEPEYSLVKVYLFNVTNPDETINGDAPLLSEVGPFVYRLRRQRYNITTTQMNTVKYQLLHTYEYLPEDTTGSLDDLINIVNVPFVSAVANLLNVPFMGLGLIDNLVKANEKLVRKNERIGDLLFDGINVTSYVQVIAALGQAPPPSMEGGRFGILKAKNGTDEGQFEVEDRPSYLHASRDVVSWKNMTSLKYWLRDSCNKIQGTDGSIFPRGLQESSKLTFFSPEACRSVSLVYDEAEQVQSVPGLRFVFPETLLASAEEYYPNTCYCKDYDDFEEDFSVCTKKGVVDLSTCRGAPIASSFPHFLDADPQYTEDVHGMNPDKSLHSSSIVVEPVKLNCGMVNIHRIMNNFRQFSQDTGTVLRSNLKFQLNMRTGSLSKIRALSQIKDYLFPAMWIENSYILDEEKAGELCSRTAEDDYEQGNESDDSQAPVDTKSHGHAHGTGNTFKVSLSLLLITFILLRFK